MSRTGVKALVLWAGFAVSCGGHASPTAGDGASAAAGWAARTVVSVVSGETGEPVVGARVTAGGLVLTTDGTGVAVVPSAVGEGAPVDVEAAGFLTRQTTVRAAAARMDLWPDDPRLPGSYTQQLVYTRASTTDGGRLVPLERLPPSVRSVVVVPSDALEEDGVAVAALRRATDEFNAAAAGRVRFSLDGSADLKVPARVAPDDPACEGQASRLLARTWTSGHEVTRAEILFCGAEPTRLWWPIAHEMGHVFGLGHSAEPRDLMYPWYTRDAEHGFSGREALLMGLLQRRRGGNAWPDDDRAATASAAGVRTFVN